MKVINVDCGGGARMSIADTSGEINILWQQRHAQPDCVVRNRMLVADLLSSYDYLLSTEITQGKSIERLKKLRKAKAAL